MAHVWLQLTYLATGRIQDALDTSANLSRTMGRIAPAWRVLALARAGRAEEARRALAELDQVARSGNLGPANLPFALAALGDTEAAVQRLEQAFEERHPQLPFMKLLHLGPEWDAVLADARVQALMRKMGLPE